MLEYINSNKVELLYDIRKKYPKCKILLSCVDLTDMSNVKGKVYAISHTKDTFDKLCELQGELENKGIMAMITGSYDGGTLGVQYEVRK